MPSLTDKAINCLPLRLTHISHISQKRDNKMLLYCIAKWKEKTIDNERDFWALVQHYGNIVFWHHCFPTVSSKHLSCNVSLTVVNQSLSSKPFIFAINWQSVENSTEQGPLWNLFRGIATLIMIIEWMTSKMAHELDSNPQKSKHLVQ